MTRPPTNCRDPGRPRDPHRTGNPSPRQEIDFKRLKWTKVATFFHPSPKGSPCAATDGPVADHVPVQVLGGLVALHQRSRERGLADRPGAGEHRGLVTQVRPHVLVEFISARKANAREVLSHERHAKDD